MRPSADPMELGLPRSSVSSPLVLGCYQWAPEGTLEKMYYDTNMAYGVR